MHDPARRHAAAARAWLVGGAAIAVKRYGKNVIDWPRDILALVVANALDFRLGRRRMLRDRVAQVLPEWEAATPGYASVLAMYAFGLEENGHYRRAEKIARRALARRFGDQFKRLRRIFLRPTNFILARFPNGPDGLHSA